MTEDTSPGFWPYERILDRLECVAARHDNASLRRSGEIAILRLEPSRDSAGPSTGPQVWLQGGLHACEWTGPSVIMRLIEELLTSPAMLELAEWHLVPVVDVAGYRRTWAGERFLKTTESGENANLNFPFRWGEGPPWLKRILGRRLQRWMGPHPESAACVKALVSALEGLRDLRLFVDFHSFGRRWLHPWCHTTEPSEHHEAHVDASAVAVEAANSVCLEGGYRAHAAAKMELPIGGSCLDFAYGELGCIHSYVVELGPDLPWVPGAVLRGAFRGDPKRWWKQGMSPDPVVATDSGDEMTAAMFALAEHVLEGELGTGAEGR